MTTYMCPNGHSSGDPQWCDTCGAPIGGSASAAAPPPSPSSPRSSTAPSAPIIGTIVDCPNCGLSNDAGNLFCEQCGYDFTTGQAPPKVEVDEPPASADAEPESGVKWVVVVEVDQAWYGLKGSLADQPCPAASSSTVALTQHTALIGRSSQSRDIHPEIALEGDNGVSRRHAQLVRDGDDLAVLDLSSTNGTYVVPAGSEPTDVTDAIEAGQPTALHDGDRIYLGAWSRLT
ncbi:MAG: FHA domain-containing protein, partial [Ilumatobacteraceae bacterium]